MFFDGSRSRRRGSSFPCRVELAFVLGEPLIEEVHRLRRAACHGVRDPRRWRYSARVEMVDEATGHSARSSTRSPTTPLMPGWSWGRAVKPLDVDLRWASGAAVRQRDRGESGVAAAVLNHPANGVAWLVNKLAPIVGLEAGQVILAGSF
jgi:2-oxo-hept-3-ene-1,7-dioate hydratase